MSYYINGDDGYHWLTCDDCDEVLHLVEAGVYFFELEAAVATHRTFGCHRKLTTPLNEVPRKTVAKS